MLRLSRTAQQPQAHMYLFFIERCKITLIYVDKINFEQINRTHIYFLRRFTQPNRILSKSTSTTHTARSLEGAISASEGAAAGTQAHRARAVPAQTHTRERTHAELYVDFDDSFANISHNNNYFLTHSHFQIVIIF